MTETPEPSPRFNTARNYFLIPTAMLLVAAAPALLLNSKGDLHLVLNSVHSPALDTFFVYTSFLGSGWFAIAVVLALLFLVLDVLLWRFFTS